MNIYANFVGSLSTPSPLQGLGSLGFALRDSALRAQPRQAGAARLRVRPSELVAPAAPSDPERR